MNSGKRRGPEVGKQQGRPPLRGATVRGQVQTTLGELIAAAFDIVGDEVKSVARLVSSSDMAKVIGKRIVVSV